MKYLVLFCFIVSTFQVALAQSRAVLGPVEASEHVLFARADTSKEAARSKCAFSCGPDSGWYRYQCRVGKSDGSDHGADAGKAAFADLQRL